MQIPCSLQTPCQPQPTSETSKHRSKSKAAQEYAGKLEHSGMCTHRGPLHKLQYLCLVFEFSEPLLAKAALQRLERNLAHCLVHLCTGQQADRGGSEQRQRESCQACTFSRNPRRSKTIPE